MPRHIIIKVHLFQLVMVMDIAIEKSKFFWSRAPLILRFSRYLTFLRTCHDVKTTGLPRLLGLKQPRQLVQKRKHIIFGRNFLLLCVVVCTSLAPREQYDLTTGGGRVHVVSTSATDTRPHTPPIVPFSFDLTTARVGPGNNARAWYRPS